MMRVIERQDHQYELILFGPLCLTDGISVGLMSNFGMLLSFNYWHVLDDLKLAIQC